uniref:Uncharacterized protein n=1 Tax=Pyrodinium bahamense TaxID=73915 RepID=A0A7S0AIL4_9DINO|mmetsp:Transcript_35080/g.97002  ORF Transcript_35080/g.97002 Transcript_35080/m.97002 type:complete len:388 (+) Transcript_35080:145-1308(+)
MPLYEEKFVSPFAIRFSQERIRPTFQDGRLVDRSMAQIEAVPWPLDGSGGYDVLLSAPFPPIEIIRWRPKIREEDGRTCIDEDGKKMLGEACWFTFDNRRLYCLQAAAAKVWPRRAAAIVHVMHDLPLSRSTPRKFRTTDLGNSVRISRRHDPVPRATWCWAEATRSCNSAGPMSEAGKAALDGVLADAAKEDWSELIDVPGDLPQRSSVAKPTPAVSASTSPQGTNGHAPLSSEVQTSLGLGAGLAAPARPAAGRCQAGAPTAPGVSWPGMATQQMAGAASFSRASSSSSSAASAMPTLAAAPHAAPQGRQDPAALANGQPTGSLFSGVTGPSAMASTAMAPTLAASLLPAAGPLSNNGPLLGGPQLLPVSTAADDDDDEDNCVQS